MKIETYLTLVDNMSPSLQRIEDNTQKVLHSCEQTTEKVLRMGHAMKTGISVDASAFDDWSKVLSSVAAKNDELSERMAQGQARQQARANYRLQQQSTLLGRVGLSYRKLRAEAYLFGRANDVARGKLTLLRSGIALTASKGAMHFGRLAVKVDNLKGHISKATDNVERLGGRMSMLKSVLVGNVLANAFIRLTEAIKDSVTGLFHLSDAYMGIQARLGMIGGSQQNAVILNDMIYESAQRARGGYMEMAEAVNQIAMNARDAFPDPREAVAFTEGIQKLFAIGGASKESQKFAMLQLTQGLASGQLQGDEFRSIAENAPIIENYIAKSLGVSRGELKKLSSAGVITAEVIKKAVFDNMDEINTLFESAPLKWGDHLVRFKNQCIKAFRPVLEYINKIAQNKKIGRMFEILTDIVRAVAPVFMVMLKVLETGFDILASIVIGVYDFITKRSWLLYGILMILGGAFTYMAIQAGIAAVSFMAQAIATGLLEIAQWALNTALYACPLVWIIGLVVIFIGVIYGLVTALNKWCGTNVTVLGVIGAYFGLTFALITNAVITTWNFIVAFAEYLANAFTHPLDATYNLFADVWNGIVDLVLEAVNTILKATAVIPVLKKLFGDANPLSKDAFTIQRKDYKGQIKLDALKMQTVDPYEWAKKGMAMGDGIHEWASNLTKTKTTPKEYDPKTINPPIQGNKDIEENTKQTADNTGKMLGAIEMTSEEIKALKESAMQQVMKQFHEQHVVVEIENNNTISSDIDIDGMTSQLVKGIRDAVTMKREGVTA